MKSHPQPTNAKNIPTTTSTTSQNRNMALMMKAASTSETSVNTYKTTRRNNPEDSHPEDLLQDLHSTHLNTLACSTGLSFNTILTLIGNLPRNAITFVVAVDISKLYSPVVLNSKHTNI
jgi:hypothetical protein